jgi:hypothetical protein
MAKLKDAIMILGDGITEFYYFHSLCDIYKGLTIAPDYPKHTDIKNLAAKIEDGIQKGYSHIFCVIDMDTKDEGPEKTKYAALKQKYANPINKPKQGLFCEVRFFETHRCTELFFLYYFLYTSREYSNQDTLLRDLNRSVSYEKKEDFFKRRGGLHAYFEGKGGSLESAIKNAEKSMREKNESGRSYTYSELGRLMKELDRLVSVPQNE